MADGVSYQNKDILLKTLSDTYRDKSFSAYGLQLPAIKEVLPTNLPKISADEKQLDNLFLLEDGTYAIVDYESVYKRSNKIKYLNYVARIADKYFADDDITIRLVIIYTGDVEQAEPELDIGCITLRTEQAFLIKIDGISEYQAIEHKIENNQLLDDNDIMKLIILPLTQKGKEGKQDMLQKAVEVTKKITDEKLQVIAISGLLVACDKFVDAEYSEKIRRFLDMTKVGRIIERERIEYGNQIAKETAKETAQKTAKILLEREVDILTIMEATGLSEDEILSLKDTVLV
ncbi:MAG: hypothetical protein FWC09_04600 [Lachnospiraceae bacterium]|nr:hypothetical protein [Lachnospiraceae bacterium]